MTCRVSEGFIKVDLRLFKDLFKANKDNLSNKVKGTQHVNMSINVNV